MNMLNFSDSKSQSKSQIRYEEIALASPVGLSKGRLSYRSLPIMSKRNFWL